MPFTPFHLGPAVVVGLIFRRYLHAPTFIVASIILDLEPFTVLVFGLRYPLHGYLHTFMVAFGIGLLLGYTMYVLDRVFKPLWNILLLTPIINFKSGSFFIAGSSGTLLHVLIDSPLYYDMKPLYPIPINPLYNPNLTGLIYDTCALLGVIGLIYYLYLVLHYNVGIV